MSAVEQARLMDRKRIAAELGIPVSGAETLMRQLPKVWIGRRVYVERVELDRYLKSAAKR